jgi:hypothetical protein
MHTGLNALFPGPDTTLIVTGPEQTVADKKL